MLKLFKLLSKLALVACGIFIGDMYIHGFEWITFVGVVLSIVMHYLYIYYGAQMLREKSRFKIRELKLGDPKPEEMPEEVWDKLQGLLQYSASNEDEE